jgi:hypothetical protein
VTAKKKAKRGRIVIGDAHDASTCECWSCQVERVDPKPPKRIVMGEGYPVMCLGQVHIVDGNDNEVKLAWNEINLGDLGKRVRLVLEVIKQ